MPNSGGGAGGVKNSRAGGGGQGMDSSETVKYVNESEQE